MKKANIQVREIASRLTGPFRRLWSWSVCPFIHPREITAPHGTASGAQRVTANGGSDLAPRAIERSGVGVAAEAVITSMA